MEPDSAASAAMERLEVLVGEWVMEATFPAGAFLPLEEADFGLGVALSVAGLTGTLFGAWLCDRVARLGASRRGRRQPGGSAS